MAQMVATPSWDSIQSTRRSLPCRRGSPFIVIPTPQPDDATSLNRLSHEEGISGARWLVLEANETFLRNVYVPFDARLLLASPAEADGSVRLQEAFRAAPGANLLLTPFGVWSRRGGLQATKLHLNQRRKDLHGFQMKGVTLSSAPLSIVRLEDKKPAAVSGLIGDIWSALEEAFNFTTQLRLSPDGSWGAREPASGRWSGMIGEVASRQADVAVAAFFFAQERLDVTDFLPPFMTTPTSVYIQRPTAPPARWDTYVLPFRASLWLAAAALVAAAAAALAAAAPGRAADHVLFVLGALCQQESEPDIPAGEQDTAGSRMARWTWAAATVVLYVAFTSQLTAGLATAEPRLPFTTFEEMLHDGTHRLAVLDRSSLLEVFHRSRNPVLLSVFRQLIAPALEDPPKSLDEGFLRVCRRRRYAFVNSAAAFASARPALPCELAAVPDTAFPTAVGLPLAKRSPYRMLLSSGVQQLRRAGILQRIQLRYWPRLQAPAHSTVRALSLRDVLPALAIWATAAVVASLQMLLERRLAARARRNSHLLPRRRHVTPYFDSYI